MENTLANALQRGDFVVTCEIIPGRGACEKSQQELMEDAVGMFATGRVHAISITDNPGGNPALLADTFAKDLLDKGITPLVHMSCKDRNRNQLMAQLYSMERNGIENILAMTGDYPVSGWEGRSRPTFDIDPVHLLQMIRDMNAGLEVPGPRGTVATETATHFNAGAVVSPFKWTEGELIPQYYKLDKKIEAGARYIIGQLGYDARKMDELMRYVREKGYNVPIIGNIYILPAGAARYMNGGNVPGAYVSDALVATLTEEATAEDKGKSARLLRAAEMIAMCRGMGYSGVHIGGAGLTADVVNYLLDTADQLQDNWQELARKLLFGVPGGYYLYKEDPATGLNTDERAEKVETRRDRAVQKNYGLSRFVHKLVFTPCKKFFPTMHRMMLRKEKKKGFYRDHGIEHIGKAVLYGCLDCGDCGLSAVAYICPMTQCPKCQRNGPCGGSSDGGWCEVYPNERLCVWYRAYHRLKKHGEEQSVGDYIIAPNDWTNYETSAWGNYHHGRDNAAKRERITPIREGEVVEPPFEEWK